MIVEVRFVVNEDTVVITSDGLEECGAPRAGGAEDDKHFALPNQPIKVAQDIDARLALAKQSANDPDALKPDVQEVLLVVGGGTVDKDIEMLVSYASRAKLVSLVIYYVNDGLGPDAVTDLWSIRTSVCMHVL